MKMYRMHTGKIFIGCLLLIAAISCKQEKPDKTAADRLVKELIEVTGKEDFQNLSTYYTDEMNSGEPEQLRIDKLKKLNEVLGKVKGIDLQSATDTIYNGRTAVYLIYKISHTRVTSTQKFMVVNEGGNYKISQQSIESIN